MGANPHNDQSWVRPPEFTVLPDEDVALLKAEIEKCGAKTILEFGPGASTEVFLSLGLKVTTCEYIDKWLDIAKEQFKGRAKVLRFYDEDPVRVDGLKDDEQFDIAFIDAPKGTTPGRFIHPAFPDCSRFNTALFALQLCPLVLLHDSSRPLEKATLGRLNSMGYEFQQLDSLWGLARITHGNEKRPDLSRAEESGGVTAGSSPVSGGIPIIERSDRLDDNGTGKKGRSVRRGRRPARGSLSPSSGAHPGVESSSRVRSAERPGTSGASDPSGTPSQADGVD